MPSKSGHSAKTRIAARKRIRAAALLAARKRSSIHYTQGWRRWDFIRLKKPPWKWANYADCSSLATWLHWTATARIYGTKDYVNNAGWRAGYTGTQTRNGRRISKPSLVGDLVFYGGSYSVPGHVAIYIGNGLVVSHGSESGPHILRWNYRPVMQVRRYL
jgi:cell wall-associated NlpC family hydrolase